MSAAAIVVIVLIGGFVIASVAEDVTSAWKANARARADRAAADRDRAVAELELARLNQAPNRIRYIEPTEEP